jgi:hypothetical protein
MANFVDREKLDDVASDSLGCRDFNLLSKEAQQLVIITTGDQQIKVPGQIDCFIKNLGKNLSRSDRIKQSAQLIYQGKPLAGSSEDYLMIIAHDIVSTYHKGTYIHMVQVYWFLCLLHALIKDQGDTGLTNFGTEERRVIKHLASTMDETRWDKVKFAGIIHDVCKMAFFLDFWLATGEFNQGQANLLPFHTSLFLPLAEMFDVDPEITALAVLHHYFIKEYPGQDIVHLFDSLFLDDTFCFMVEAMNIADCYSALRAKRPEYRPTGVESFSHNDAFDMIKSIVKDKGMGKWFVKCIELLHQSGHIEWLFPEKPQSSALLPA